MKKLAYVGYWMWNTAEVRNLIEWMKQYNTDKPTGEQLSFYDFDCKVIADNDIYTLVDEFMAKVDVDLSYTLPELTHNPERIEVDYSMTFFSPFLNVLREKSRQFS
ncbi:erythromycin esterase family protein [Spirosoma flavum]|uniref:Erythromycin esterase family protein n=1 Tax=Spirosoma flavum TaxID=2048557 RepID=A0ABW6AK67_9BACT